MYSLTWTSAQGVSHAVVCGDLQTARFLRARLRPVFDAVIRDLLLGTEVE